MAKVLGILASSDKHLGKIIKLCRQAKHKEIEVIIFFTHFGLHLSQDPRFEQMEGLARMFICEAGFRNKGFKPPIPGIAEENFATQSRHCEIIGLCDRYLVF